MITFRKIDVPDLHMIGKWREKPRINDVMTSKYTYFPVVQLSWYERLVHKGMDEYNWIILEDDRPVGLINLADFKPYEGETSWGFYIGDDSFKFGPMIPPYLYNKLFIDDSKIHTIKAQVLWHNQKVIKLHLKHGYTIDGMEDDTMHMRLSKTSWACQTRWHDSKMVII